ncbi:hypothetical protein HCA73_16955, partial [Listeria booriae]|nr:hypothetical protein [Listeria booriae]
RESISEAKATILNQGIDISEDEFREWTAKIWSEINIEIPCGVSNQDEKRVNEGNYPKETFFWERYRSSLEKDRDSVAIDEIDKYTKRIMSHITPPREEGSFDKRG